MKKFYKSVTVASDDRGNYGIRLDGRPVKTPAKHMFFVPSRALADAVAGEWDIDQEIIDPSEMPLTRLANSAVDRVSVHRESVVDEIVRFAETDLICYRVTEPEALHQRQSAGWDPLIEWMKTDCGAEFIVTDGLLPVRQSDRTLENIRKLVSAHDDFRLSGLHMVCSACASVVLGLAVAEGKIDGRRAWELSLVEETYQIEEWGEDPEATKRRTGLLNDIDAAARFLKLL